MRRTTWTAGLAAALASAACGESEPVAPSCASEPAVVTLEAQGTLPLLRLNDGVLLTVSVVTGCGVTVQPAAVVWASSDPGVVSVRGVQGGPGGEGFALAQGFGSAEITATVAGSTGRLQIEVRRPENVSQGFTVLGNGRAELATTDLWVHGSHAYSASQVWACGGAGETPCSEARASLYVWALDGAGGVTLVHTVALPTAKANDVKVSADGSVAVVTLETRADGNGILVFDLTDPAAPAQVAHVNEGLETGVHNAWLERIDGVLYVFVVADGTSADAGLRIYDLSDPARPVEVASYYGGSSSIHDVYVREGLAFVSHWDLGLVILDVGHGAGGGSPTAPVELSRLEFAGGNVHNAWYWPERGIAFIGQEIFPPPGGGDPEDVGHVSVVDVSDPTLPQRVARFDVPGQTPHNFWVDERAAILYAAWYTKGVWAIDVSGELAGDLAEQGRGLGSVVPSGPRGAASVWAPQLHDGVLYLSDIFNGVWAVRYDG